MASTWLVCIINYIYNNKGSAYYKATLPYKNIYWKEQIDMFKNLMKSMQAIGEMRNVCGE